MASKELLISALCVTLLGAGLLFATSNPNRLAPPEVTFSRDVAPIFYEHCAGCHRPNDIAPFSVLEYGDVSPWANSIREKVSNREMPPWHADPRYGDFANDARLSRREIETISNWVAQGAKEGNPDDLPELPREVTGWKIGKPDLVLAMSEEYTVPAHSPDNYVYVTFPTKFKEDRWVQAVEIRPGNTRIVHHVIAHVLTPEALSGERKASAVSFPRPMPSRRSSTNKGRWRELRWMRR